MSTTFDQWARDWGLPPAAVEDFKRRAGAIGPMALDAPHGRDASESAQQSKMRLEYAQHGIITWRNNVGVLEDERGTPVRFGLANENPGQNKVLKSSDLIGIRPRLITPDMVGTRIGQFFAREAKHLNWVYTGKGREAAQMAFIEQVKAYGGDAAFATGPGSL